MEVFLADIEKRAYHMAAFATGSHADALDLLQDSMIKLVTHYQEKPSGEWKPLFYRILQNKIRDWHRHQKIRNLAFFWKPLVQDEEVDDWPPATASSHDLSPENSLENNQQHTAVLKQLKQLSDKQQQCFLLRSWEGLSVAETAIVMECSEGTIKTHHSRAVAKMKQLMEANDDFSF